MERFTVLLGQYMKTLRGGREDGRGRVQEEAPGA
jgi:hypothetical protein